jgi:hypothetical protein
MMMLSVGRRREAFLRTELARRLDAPFFGILHFEQGGLFP